MWGCFMGFAHKTPPHLPIATRKPKEPYLGGVLCFVAVIGFYFLRLRLGNQERFAPAP